MNCSQFGTWVKGGSLEKKTQRVHDIKIFAIVSGFVFRDISILITLRVVAITVTSAFQVLINGGLFILPYPELQIELWPCYSTLVVLAIFVPLK